MQKVIISSLLAVCLASGLAYAHSILEQTIGFSKKTHDLRFEYMEAYSNPQTTEETLANLRQQMDDLRIQMYEIPRGQQPQ